VRRIELLAARKGSLHRNGYPVSEEHSLPLKVCREMKCPLREVIDEKRASGLDDSHAVVHPFVAPIEVIRRFEVILVASIPVVFSKVEGGVREYGVDGFVFQCSDQIPTIGVVDRTKVSAESRSQLRHESPFLVHNKKHFSAILFSSKMRRGRNALLYSSYTIVGHAGSA
jgi:hypothetical protein